MKSLSAALTIALAGFSAVAHGASIAFDVNGLTVKNVAGGVGHRYSFTSNSRSTNEMRLDGVGVARLRSTEFALNGFIDVLNGTVLGGQFSITAPSDGGSFNFLVKAQPDSAATSLGTGLVSSKTENAAFATPTFAGKDVSDWRGPRPLAGTVDAFWFKSNAANLEISQSVVLVPAPAAACGGITLACVVGAARLVKTRRRSLSAQTV